MNVTRRLFGSVARATSSVPAQGASVVQYDSLPPTIYRIIERNLRTAEDVGGKVRLPNPFLTSWNASPTDDTKLVFIPATIPKRRQKQLLQRYPAHVLPPSTLNPQSEPLPVQWVDGTVVEWVGEYAPPKTESKLYSPNKRMFKGSKAERGADKKKEDRAARMAGMSKRIEDWKKQRAEEKNKNKPSLPF